MLRLDRCADKISEFSFHFGLCRHSQNNSKSLDIFKDL